MDRNFDNKVECQICGYRIYKDIYNQHKAECFIKQKENEGNLTEFINTSRQFYKPDSKKINRRDQNQSILDMNERVDCYSCGNKIKLSDLHTHEEECSNREVPCEFCGEKYPKELMESHTDFCDEKKNLQQIQRQQQQQEQQQQQRESTNQQQEAINHPLNQMLSLFFPTFSEHQQRINSNTQNTHQRNQRSEEEQKGDSNQPPINNQFISLMFGPSSDRNGQSQIAGNPGINILRHLLQFGNLDNLDYSNNGGLTNEVKKQFPTSKYKQKQGVKNNEDNIKCAICMSEYEEGEEIKHLDCLHQYHSECIDKWLEKNSKCPVCKHDMRN